MVSVVLSIHSIISHPLFYFKANIRHHIISFINKGFVSKNIKDLSKFITTMPFYTYKLQFLKIFKYTVFQISNCLGHVEICLNPHPNKVHTIWLVFVFLIVLLPVAPCSLPLPSPLSPSGFLFQINDLLFLHGVDEETFFSFKESFF